MSSPWQWLFMIVSGYFLWLAEVGITDTSAMIHNGSVVFKIEPCWKNISVSSFIDKQI